MMKTRDFGSTYKDHTSLVILNIRLHFTLCYYEKAIWDVMLIK